MWTSERELNLTAADGCRGGTICYICKACLLLLLLQECVGSRIPLFSLHMIH